MQKLGMMQMNIVGTPTQRDRWPSWILAQFTKQPPTSSMIMVTVSFPIS